jgi:Xaa-Pro aminopeptidase
MALHRDTEGRVATPISNRELERRWAAVRKEMAERRIDALVVQNNNDWLGGYVKWFTDLPAVNGYPRSVIFHAADLMTVVEMGPRGARRKVDGKDKVHRGVGEIVCTPAFTSVAYTDAYQAEIVADELKRRGYRSIGWIGAGATPHRFIAFIEQELAGRAKFVDATEFVDRLKAVKSDEERALIRRCAEMQDAVIARVLEKIRPGMRDRTQQGRTLQAGEHFSLLIENNGPGGMYTEIARTIVLGKASNEVIDGFETVKEAQANTLRLMKPGTSCRDIAEAHDGFMRARGLPAELRLYCHGQGYDLVERPLVRADETMTLAENMNLAVHPGYETNSLFAVICDNYLVEAGGPSACLHKTPKRIFEI